MSDEVAACPECDSADIQLSTFGGLRGDTRPADGNTHRCQACKARFASPTFRPPKTHRNCQTGTARALLDADPEDYPA